MGDMEKQAITARVAGFLRHPVNKDARKALEGAIREWKFNNINEGVNKRFLKKLRVGEAAEKVSRHVFFPRKSMTSKIDPVKYVVPKMTGNSVVNTLADNPELLPMMATPLIGGAIPMYMVGKSTIYKGFKIPTPSHMRHLKQSKKIKDTAIATGAAMGLAGAGVAGSKAIGKKQKARKAREAREARKLKKAVIEKRAVSGKWIEDMVRSGVRKASPQRTMEFMTRQEAQIPKLKSRVSSAQRSLSKAQKSGKARSFDTLASGGPTSAQGKRVFNRERALDKRRVAGGTAMNEHLIQEEKRLRKKMKNLSVDTHPNQMVDSRALEVSPSLQEKQKAYAARKASVKDPITGRKITPRMAKRRAKDPSRAKADPERLKYLDRLDAERVQSISKKRKAKLP